MRNLRQQLIAGFLALCLGAAGFVGLSPGLHRLVEHAGQGPAHIHSGGHIHWHDHGDGRVHAHRLETDPAWRGEDSAGFAEWTTGGDSRLPEPTPDPSEEGIRQDAIQSPDAGPRFPSLEGAGVGSGRGQNEGLHEPLEAASPSQTEPHPDHEHHGLVRMLDDGVLDCPPLWVPEFCPPAPAPCLDEFFTGRIPPSVWFAQAAGRAPPFAI